MQTTSTSSLPLQSTDPLALRQRGHLPPRPTLRRVWSCFARKQQPELLLRQAAVQHHDRFPHSHRSERFASRRGQWQRPLGLCMCMQQRDHQTRVWSTTHILPTNDAHCEIEIACKSHATENVGWHSSNMYIVLKSASDSDTPMIDAQRPLKTAAAATLKTQRTQLASIRTSAPSYKQRHIKRNRGATYDR